MGKATGIIEWFQTCPYVSDVSEFDISQVSADSPVAGLYKQPAITRQRLIDGSLIITESYYLLFRRDAKVRTERFGNEQFLESVEGWIDDQEMAENYPSIGHEVHRIEATNAFYMLERDKDNAVYQLTISLTYLKEVQTSD